MIKILSNKALRDLLNLTKDIKECQVMVKGERINSKIRNKVRLLLPL
jgi:hypothetical protein